MEVSTNNAIHRATLAKNCSCNNMYFKENGILVCVSIANCVRIAAINHLVYMPVWTRKTDFECI